MTAFTEEVDITIYVYLESKAPIEAPGLIKVLVC